MTGDILTPRLTLRLMAEPFLTASLEGDVAAAERLIGLRTPPEWYAERDLMRFRLDDLAQDAAYREWSLRAIGLAATGEMVGHIGFHTTPDAPYLRAYAADAVEFGYTVFAPYRGRGYAQEASRGVMRWAAETHGVHRFVLSIAPANAPSRHIAAKLGFVQVGSHIDDLDGPEDVFLLEGDMALGK